MINLKNSFRSWGNAAQNQQNWSNGKMIVRIII